MPFYRYRAKKGPEETVEGVLEAQSRDEAIERLSLLGLVPVHVEEKTGQDSPAGSYEGRVSRVKLRDLTVFSGQLASLIKSGVPILKAINIIAEQTENRYFRYILTSLAEEIKVGKTFSESLAAYPAIFSPLYVAIIKAGEDGGSLHLALERITGHLRKQEGVVSRVRMALIYPGLMALVGLGTVIFMLVFVIPRVKDIFTTSNQQLPVPTQILIAASNAVRFGWFWMLLAAVALVVVYKQIARKRKDLVSSLRLKIPVFGAFLRKTEIAQVTRTLELSLKSGIHLLRALELAVPVLNNEVIKRDLKDAYDQVKQGGSLGRSLKKSKNFPVFMSNFVIIGEESGKLESVFSEIADYYERDTDEALRVFTSQLEPLMILLIGSVLGFVVIAILLPIFQINLMVQ